ncbi:hypothetical protein JCM16303_006784 [Sporobolomyces ruberrimus]
MSAYPTEPSRDQAPNIQHEPIDFEAIEKVLARICENHDYDAIATILVNIEELLEWNWDQIRPDAQVNILRSLEQASSSVRVNRRRLSEIRNLILDPDKLIADKPADEEAPKSLPHSPVDRHRRNTKLQRRRMRPQSLAGSPGLGTVDTTLSSPFAPTPAPIDRPRPRVLVQAMPRIARADLHPSRAQSTPQSTHLQLRSRPRGPRLAAPSSSAASPPQRSTSSRLAPAHDQPFPTSGNQTHQYSTHPSGLVNQFVLPDVGTNSPFAGRQGYFQPVQAYHSQHLSHTPSQPSFYPPPHAIRPTSSRHPDPHVDETSFSFPPFPTENVFPYRLYGPSHPPDPPH